MHHLPLTPPAVSTEKDTKLIEAAIAVIELHERHLADSELRAKLMQQAAAAARRGEQQEARNLQSRVTMMGSRVFSYEHVFRDLTKAVKPFRKRTKRTEAPGA